MNKTQIIVEGFDEKLIPPLQNIIEKLLEQFEQQLDCSNLESVIITSDYAVKLESFKKGRTTPVEYTNEDYAVGVAQVVPFLEEGRFYMRMVINGKTLLTGIQSPKRCSKFWANLLHHEFIHVHDTNKKYQALKEVWMTHKLSGKNAYFFPIAEGIWSEYYANKFSSSSLGDEGLYIHTINFANALYRTKEAIDQEIIKYRTSESLECLMNFALRHGGFLLKSAAYFHGCLDGLGINVEQICTAYKKKLSNQLELEQNEKEEIEKICGLQSFLEESYFYTTWCKMIDILRGMNEKYPDWESFHVYDDLVLLIDCCFVDLGLEFSDVEEGIYIDVPLRPETTPNTLSLFGKFFM